MLTIGDFSRLSRVTPRMLRHYDALPLLHQAAPAGNSQLCLNLRKLSAGGSPSL